MKDKISKIKNLIKKYGVLGTTQKAAGYVYSNYMVKLSLLERLYIALNRKKFIAGINRILEKIHMIGLLYGEALLVGMSLFTRDLSIFLLILLSRKLLFSMKLPGLQMMLSASKSRRTTYIL